MRAMINISISVFLVNAGAPVTALTPTIWVYDLTTGAVVVDGLAMTELGHGLYVYLLEATDQLHVYKWAIDGGSGLSVATDRYKDGIWQNAPVKGY